MHYLDFEKPIATLEGKINELRHVSGEDSSVNITEDILKLESKVEKELQQIYKGLTPVQKVQVARHPDRPHYKDYLAHLIDDFTPLAGDRNYRDDPALIGGLGRFEGQAVVVLGHEKGSDTESRIKHNFGMPCPEGYRKASRLLEMADQFGLPVLSFIDTPGAYPGLGAEERGQSEAIARAIESCLRTGAPLIGTIIGEGGSGGAIAIATTDKVLMLEHSIYSVISPEGCAGILWRDGKQADQAASALKLTAQDLIKLGLIDDIIDEPLGGAHRNPDKIFEAVRNAIRINLKESAGKDPSVIKKDRREKYLRMTQGDA